MHSLTPLSEMSSHLSVVYVTCDVSMTSICYSPQGVILLCSIIMY